MVMLDGFAHRCRARRHIVTRYGGPIHISGGKWDLAKASLERALAFRSGTGPDAHYYLGRSTNTRVTGSGRRASIEPPVDRTGLTRGNLKGEIEASSPVALRLRVVVITICYFNTLQIRWFPAGPVPGWHRACHIKGRINPLSPRTRHDDSHQTHHRWGRPGRRSGVPGHRGAKSGWVYFLEVRSVPG
jgi:hypothetical protein